MTKRTSLKKTPVLFKNIILRFSCFGNGTCSEILGKINRHIKTPAFLCSLPYPPLINTKRVIGFHPYKEINPAMFYWSVCTKPGMRTALHFCCWILELFAQCAIFFKLIYVFLYLFNYYLDLFYYFFCCFSSYFFLLYKSLVERQF